MNPELIKKWPKALYAIGVVIMFSASEISKFIIAPMRGVTLFGVGLLLIAGSFDFKDYYKNTEEKVGFLANILLVIGVGVLLVSLGMLFIQPE